ncbi:E3 ubiquitin-protein ligase rififylin [Oryzias melastigma]|uniref:RING-type E3 ubiquitin transferase n=1 Tax=Oryzias melastigma TaxID=30732 RepID=A0A834FLT6_ORYME|nr:E3 ubiquitin-protein ligase rififylin [Oryzias melastigma]XP_036070719.1 E3 ubiquitin-protein ligase rififylin [Oryzias melastigma]XP_036070720.1 E3 ubiquitin-protein ligase rififylin [Oryzias melastigma]KAF6736549.1 E3 ubiquitin-protein ligase rififylin [Oryzias melastigma]
MFASCCNWLCMDTAEGGAAEHQAYTNSAFSGSQPPSPEHGCTACGGRFDTPAKKHTCADCKKSYCSRCSAHIGPRPRLCHTCQPFYGNQLERAELMKLRVKDLREYLCLHEVPTHLCREKEELVDLVLGQQSSPSSSSAPETPVTEAPSMTFDPPDLASDPAPHTSTSPPPTPPSPPDPHPAEPEAPPPVPETAPPEPVLQDEDQMWDGEEAPASGRRASLSDLSGPEDIEALSVRQLKEILARNFVDYKGCCEKWELMERVTRLYQDQQNLLEVTSAGTADGAAAQEEHLCRICMDSPIDCVLLECGHMVTCTKCGKRMSECPICRQYVIRAVHVFRS